MYFNYRSKLDDEQQPHFHQSNKPSSALNRRSVSTPLTAGCRQRPETDVIRAKSGCVTQNPEMQQLPQDYVEVWVL